MKIKITLNKLTYEKEIPTRWEEVTFRQFMDLSEVGEDYAKVLSIFTGIDPEVIRTAAIYRADQVIQLLSFLRQPPDMSHVPQKIKGYTIPKDLGLMYVKQHEDLKHYILEGQKKETHREQMEQYCMYCAIYACPYEFGEYDWAKAESMKHYFMDAPAVEVLAVGNFTLLKLIGSNVNINVDYPQPRTQMQKFRLAFQMWVKHLAFSVRWFLWKRKQELTAKNS